MNGRLLIVSGPSGVGKDTVIDRWKETNQLVDRVVAATTRRPRNGEVDGRDYHFVSQERFLQLEREGAFLEHENVHGFFYGTPTVSVHSLLSQGKIAILKIDVRGALKVMAKLPEVTSVFLLPPSWEALEERIRQRGTDDESTIETRLSNAREEISHSTRYTHQVVNDSLEETVNALEAIVRAEATLA